jgi:hypothetical protein
MRIHLVPVLLPILALAGCATPDAVSKFCASATATLTAANPVFEDMKQSCLREVNGRTPFGTFQPPNLSDPDCESIGLQANRAQAAADVLAGYIEAINALASFGRAERAHSENAASTTDTTSASPPNSPQAAALASMTRFLASAATLSYRQKQLDKDLMGVSANVSAVANALAAIVEEDYLTRQLKSEEEKLTTRYKEFARGKSPEVTLLLEDRWSAEEQAIQARRACARSLVTALKTLAKGFEELAMNTHRINAKEVPGLLEPYADQLQTLIPQIQKAF